MPKLTDLTTATPTATDLIPIQPIAVPTLQA